MNGNEEKNGEYESYIKQLTPMSIDLLRFYPLINLKKRII